MASYEEVQASLRQAINDLSPRVPTASGGGVTRDLAEAVERLANAAQALKSTYNVAPDRHAD
jgi:hypothetical protein